MKTTVLFFFSFLFTAFSQQNFWERTNGPYGGSTGPISISSTGNIFAGTSGGIFRSTNDGRIWVPDNNGITSKSLGIFSEIIDSTGNIFVSTGYDIFKSTDQGSIWMKKSNGLQGIARYFAIKSTNSILTSTDNGIYQSTDSGDNWYHIGLYGVGPIAVSSKGSIFAGNYNGMFRSTNGGAKWDTINAGLEKGGLYYGIRTLLINKKNNIYVGSSSGIFRSTNNGDNWEKILDLQCYCLTLNNNDMIFAGVFKGIYKSTDNGDNWIEADSGLSNWDFNSLAVDSNNNVFVGTATGIEISTNNGQIWSESDIGLAATRVSSLRINNSGIIFAASEKGISTSTDNGNTWFDVLNKAGSIAFNSSNQIFVFTGLEIYRSTNNGADWLKVNDRTGNCFTIGANGYLFVGTNYDWRNGSVQGILRSTDNGTSWEQIDNGLPTEGESQFEVNCFGINSTGEIFAGLDLGMFKSVNNGDGWEELNQLSVSNFLINSNGDIFAGTIGNGLFRSTDDGENWSIIGSGIFNNVFSLSIDSTGNIFAGTESFVTDTVGGIYKSTDNGDTWFEINNGIENRFYPLTMTSSNDYTFVGTGGGGVYKRLTTTAVPIELIIFKGGIFDNSIQLKWSTATEINNKGFEIQRKPSGVNEKDLLWNSIGFVDGNGTTTEKKNYTFIDKSVSSGKYIYRLKQTDFDGIFTYSKEIEINFLAPLTFSLSQNYPNPFNPSTTIEYTLPEDSNVKLTLINSLGEKVMDLVNGKVNSGNHEVKLNGTNLASGIYFYRLQTEKYTSVKKFNFVEVTI